MTPEPPSSSSSRGSSLPSRHRPALEDLSHDTTELDLWAFDEDLEMTEQPSVPVVPKGKDPDRRRSGEIPAKRERRVEAEEEVEVEEDAEVEAVPEVLEPKKEQIRMDVSRPRKVVQPPADGKVMGVSKTESEFDDLEQWEDSPAGEELEKLPVEPEPEPEAPAPVEAQVVEPEEAADAEPGEAVEMEPECKPAEENELEAPKKATGEPVSLRPSLGLTKVERVGMVVLALLLVAAAIGAAVFSLNRLPKESVRVKANDFPIKGEHLTIRSAASYWRAPEGSDTVRIGTRLLPAIEMDLAGDTGALRVVFRNQDQEIVGDVVTVPVREGGTLEVPATAGFDDLGMHAAYRTGGSDPWTITVSEAPDAGAGGSDFQRVFEMTISTDRR